MIASTSTSPTLEQARRDVEEHAMSLATSFLILVTLVTENPGTRPPARTAHHLRRCAELARQIRLLSMELAEESMQLGAEGDA